MAEVKTLDHANEAIGVPNVRGSILVCDLAEVFHGLERLIRNARKLQCKIKNIALVRRSPSLKFYRGPVEYFEEDEFKTRELDGHHPDILLEGGQTRNDCISAIDFIDKARRQTALMSLFCLRVFP